MITLRPGQTAGTHLGGAAWYPVTLAFDHFVYLGRGSWVRRILGPKLLVFLKFRILPVSRRGEPSYSHLWIAEHQATWLSRWQCRIVALLGRWLTRKYRYSDGWTVHDIIHAPTGSRLQLRMRLWWDRWGLVSIEIAWITFDQPRTAVALLREMTPAKAAEKGETT